MFYASRLAGQRGDAAEDIRATSGQPAPVPAGRRPARRDLRPVAPGYSPRPGAVRYQRPSTWGLQSVERARELGDPWYLAMALNNYGYSRVMSGNVDDQTEELLAESLRLRRSLDEKRGVGITLGSIAELQLLRGDLDAAATTVEEMLTLSTALTHAELTSITLNLHGFLHLARGNPAQAAGAIPGLPAALPPPGIPAPGRRGPAGPRRSRGPAGGLHPRAAVRRGRQPGPHRSRSNSSQASTKLRSAASSATLEQALDQPAQQAIRTAAETATLNQVLAEAAMRHPRLTIPARPEKHKGVHRLPEQRCPAKGAWNANPAALPTGWLPPATVARTGYVRGRQSDLRLASRRWQRRSQPVTGCSARIFKISRPYEAMRAHSA